MSFARDYTLVDGPKVKLDIETWQKNVNDGKRVYQKRKLWKE